MVYRADVGSKEASSTEGGGIIEFMLAHQGFIGNA